MNYLLTLSAPRTDTPAVLPNPADSGFSYKDEEEKPKNAMVSFLIAIMSGRISLLGREPVDPSLRGFHHVALLRDSPSTGKEQLFERFLRHKKVDTVRYLQQVRQKITAKGHEISAKES